MKLTEGKDSTVDWACASETMPGQQESGDRCLVKSHGRGALIAVIDGLGHGHEAAQAAEEAARVLDQGPRESVIALVQSAHHHLRNTRGAVMTLASLNSSDHTLTWLAVGNVQGAVFRTESDSKTGYESVILRGGVVGYQLPPLKAEVIPIAAGALVILATDGIYGGFTVGLNPKEASSMIAERVLREHSKGNDDALVMVARYLGQSDENRSK